MQILLDEDIQLLFHSLVVLPQDKVEKKAEPVLLTTAQEDAPSKNTVDAEQPTNETTRDTTTKDIAEEPKATYSKTIPFAILVPQELKQHYLAEGSAFLKIIDALAIPQVTQHLYTDYTILQNADKYTCLWCIALDIKTEKTALSLDHKNLLTSPDILSLKTNEEKKAMYIPLKAFISSNMELISKL